MASDAKLVADSLEEMLVSIAEGVREAQDALDALPPTDAFGRPVPGYFIPHLDFELVVDVQTETNNAGRPIFKVSAARSVFGGGGGGSSTSKSTAQTTSRITGRLVAIPPGEGLPVPQLVLSSEKVSPGVIVLRVQASNSAGETMAGQRIELNIDTEASKALSRGEDPTLPTARLADAVLVTDEQGEASTRLTIESGGNSSRQLVVVAQLGIATARVMIGTAG